MARRQIQAGALLAAGAALIALGFIGFLISPEGEPDRVIATPYGDVTWNHQLHARMKEYNCKVCHHTESTGFTTAQDCADCHKGFDDAAKAVAAHHEAKEGQSKEDAAKEGAPAMVAFHNKCIGCHKAASAGPVGCRECHAKDHVGKKQDVKTLTADDGPSVAILNHLQEKYPAIAFNHADHVDYADGCTDCHHHSFGVEAVPSCRACHKAKGSKKGSKRLGLMDAYHQQCINCHNKNESGPTSCEECHAQPAEGEEAPPSKEDYQGPDVSVLYQLKDIYEAVKFNHADHVDYADNCQKCHHEQLPLEKTPACRECHGHRVTVKGNKKLGLIDAYHAQCINCHLEMESGPTGCDDCHTKKADKK